MLIRSVIFFLQLHSVFDEWTNRTMNAYWMKWKNLVSEAGFVNAEIAISERNRGIDLSELDAQMISFSSKLILGFVAQIAHSTAA